MYQCICIWNGFNLFCYRVKNPALKFHFGKQRRTQKKLSSFKHLSLAMGGRDALHCHLVSMVTCCYGNRAWNRLGSWWWFSPKERQREARIEGRGGKLRGEERKKWKNLKKSSPSRRKWEGGRERRSERGVRERVKRTQIWCKLTSRLPSRHEHNSSLQDLSHWILKQIFWARPAGLGMISCVWSGAFDEDHDPTLGGRGGRHIAIHHTSCMAVHSKHYITTVMANGWHDTLCVSMYFYVCESQF